MAANVTNIRFENGEFQTYDIKDTSLINSAPLQRKFGLPEDYIELHLYDLNDNYLAKTYGYKTSTNRDVEGLRDTIDFDPEKDAKSFSFGYGSVKLVYNIFRKILGSDVANKFYIKDISSDRKEIRISNNNVSNENLEIYYNNFIVSFTTEAYYKDFYLNFGDNTLLIGVNIALEQDVNQYNLLIKLYEPLPAEFQVKDQFWMVDQLSEPIAYQVDFILNEVEAVEDIPRLRGPNFNVSVSTEVNSSTEYKSYDQLFSNSSTSSYQELKSLLEEKSLEINVDYTDYENFIHFSSAKERLLNFAYKLKLIEAYDRDINLLSVSPSTPQISSSRAIINSNKDGIIEKFDGYEYYLYYESGSKAWPKKNSSKPYVNYEVTSSDGISWLGSDNDESPYYGGQLITASMYDNTNQNNLVYSVPEYLRIDSENEPYELFLHMVGQQFDNIWLYGKAVTDLYDAQNNLYKGISKDLVYHALSSLGVKLYTNKSANEDLFSYMLGSTPSGSFLPSTGSEWITNYVTASTTTIAGSDLDKEIYKRIYHNLPYLLKSKGTSRGLRALIACYGIPSSILKINEYGGSDKIEGTYEQFYERSTYGLNTKTGSVYVNVPWMTSVQQGTTFDENGIWSVYQQSDLATTWSVEHSLNNLHPTVIAFDNAGYVMYPANILATDVDHLEVTFGVGSTGYIVVYDENPGQPQEYIHAQTSSAATWNVSHSLNIPRPFVTVYDESNNIVIPQNIRATDSNNVAVTFISPTAGYATILDGESLGYAFSQSVNSAVWNVSHSLNSLYPAIVVYDSGSNIVIPENIRVLDSNNVQVTFASASSGYVGILASTVGSSVIVPDTIEFRFNSEETPTSNWYSQSLFQVGSGSGLQFGVQLLYTPTVSTGAYAEYGDIRFTLSGSTGFLWTDPIRFPYFNNKWWNVMVKRETGSITSNEGTNRYWIYVANFDYGPSEGNTVTFIGSASLEITGSNSASYNSSWNNYSETTLIGYLGGQDNNNVISQGSVGFTGLLQEYRNWITPLTEDSFEAHVLNPLSIETVGSTASIDDLIYRLPLGADLDIGDDSRVYSVHPSYTYVPSTGSFNPVSPISYGDIMGIGGTSLYGVAVYGESLYFGSGSTEIIYTETTVNTLLNVGSVGMLSPNTDKIRIIAPPTSSGDTLSPYVRIEQPQTVPLTQDVNFMEVSLSPQDQVNNDIIEQLGYFNIDNYIGDPRNADSDSYPDLEVLRDYYFQKYFASYNYFDFIRIIKYYNNSLFKMIKDFIPAKANASTGIVIKPHILERSKIKRFEPEVENVQYTASIDVVETSADSGGIYGVISSSFTSYVKTTSGSASVAHTNNYEFYTGELDGTRIIASTQSLQKYNPYLMATSGSFNMDDFTHSPFNIVLNNISKSRLSEKYYDLDYSTNVNVPVNIGLINSGSPIALAEIQDSNYSLYRHYTPRYDGSKIRGLYYNVYTTSSFLYSGDISYGLDPVINYNCRKLGLFVTITSSIFLEGRQEVNIKYLVDEFGGLIDLNQQNQNWFEVQNSFKLGETATVILFDNSKYSNQKYTEGQKSIYSSGYSYLPILYFSSSTANLSFGQVSFGSPDVWRYQNITDVATEITLPPTSTDPSSSVLTYYAGVDYVGAPTPVIYWYLTNPINTREVKVGMSASFNIYTDYFSGICNAKDLLATLVQPSNAIFAVSSSYASASSVFSGSSVDLCDAVKIRKNNNGIYVSGSVQAGPFFNGDIFYLPGCITTFSVSIPTSCDSWGCYVS